MYNVFFLSQFFSQYSSQHISCTHFFFCLQHLEAVIKARIPSIQAMINKSIDEIETELNQIGRPLANDAGVMFSSLIILVLLQFDH
jgi:hypothetical protein